MNNTSDPTPSQAPGETQPEGSPNPQASPPQQGRCVLGPLCSAVTDGAHRAKAAAEQAAPKVKAAVSGATYWFGFGVSFAAVFSYIIVKELAPQVLKAGGRDGSSAGQNTAEELIAKLKTRSAHRGASSPSGAAPSEPAAEPGAA